MTLRHVYLMGPGGVGKTTVGPAVAARLARPFVDLDDEFCARLANVGAYIATHGYADYVIANSKLFAALAAELHMPAVIALSSGFLSSEILPRIVARNLALVTATGTTVLLLPGDDVAEGAETVVARQLARGFNLKAETERKKFVKRAHEYARLANYRVDSAQEPVAVAQAVMQVIAASPAPLKPSV